jgi:hypothetical protein
LLHRGTFHSNSVSGKLAVFGSPIFTPVPVAWTAPKFTLPASAVTQRRARAPPPVSSARCCPDDLSNHRGDIVHV